ncbi:MAG: folylpolyglutamate synthase/dihydrofolate synthase family protein [Planctomycetaceae bacterium]
MDKPLPTAIESYDDAVRWIYGRINYEQIRPRRSSNHFRLDRIRRLLSLINSPQDRIPAIHIAGTKGKGSTAAMIDSMLRASGIRTGLYTSPHIHRFEERMQVDGRVPDESEMTDLVARLAAILQSDHTGAAEGGPTYFEVATMLAWMYFDDQHIETAVLETGLGGRLDCTNVCHPLVTVFTTIGLDHTHILGNTHQQIAAEKAGIIKTGVPVICGVNRREAREVIESKAAELGCDFRLLGRDIRIGFSQSESPGSGKLSVNTGHWRYDDLTVPLIGKHQLRNAALAVAAVSTLSETDDRITPATIRAGLAATRWPLRFEVIKTQPTIILDAAHNPDAIEALLATLESPSWQSRRRVLIFAASKDKDAAGMLNQVVTAFDDVILTRFETNPRSASPARLRSLLPSRGTLNFAAEISESPNPEAALAEARRLADKGGLICVAGSIFLAAEIRDMLIRSGELIYTGRGER